MIVSNSSCLIILSRLEKLDLLPLVKGLLDEMMEMDFRISKTVYDDALKSADGG